MLLFMAGVELVEKSVCYEQIAQAIKVIISENSRVSSFHDLRIVGCDVNKCSVVFDIALEEDAVEKKTGKLNLSQQCRDLPMNS